MNYDKKSDLRGKRVLVTGAGTGIGCAVALEFARSGADVIVHYAHGGSGATEVAQQIRDVGRRAEVIHADLMSLLSDFRNRSTSHFGNGYVPSI